MLSGKQSNRGKGRSKLLREYLDFLMVNQCLCETTVNSRRNFVVSFLSRIKNIAFPSKLHKLSPRTIHDFIIKTSKTLRQGSRKKLVSSLRSFLRYAHVRGYLKKSLVEAVPTIYTSRLDGIPKVISWDDVKKLLAAPNRKTPPGRRNYAILLLLATYGVRIGQVKNLELQDIKWQEGLIYFKPCKNGKPLSFPLKEAVARALLEYIKKDREEIPCQKVFLTVRSPQRPPSCNRFLSLQRYYERAGICSNTKGFHAIRHAFATRLMEKKTPLKTISDLLGHRCINSTFIYTKVDTKQLRILAREWPEVAS